MPSPMTAAMIPITTACMAPPVRAPRLLVSLLALGDLRLHLLAPRLLLDQVVGHLLELSLHLRQPVRQLLRACLGALRLGELLLEQVELALECLRVDAPHEVPNEQTDEDRDDADDRHLLAVHHASFRGRKGPLPREYGQ